MTYTKLLVVDDDAIDRKTVIKTLSGEQQHYDIVEATSLVEAYQLIQDMQFDVILLDFNMPLVNGVEAIIELRGDNHLKHTAIVMISNLYDQQLVLDCINAGAQDFLLKHEITSSQLARSILQARKRHELEQQLHDSYQHIKDLAEKDTLTGLHNRFHFEEMLNRLLVSRTRRNEEIVAVMMLDLDKFKHINDHFGHDAGDRLLIAVAGRIKEILRENELLARLGGDEFAFACGELTSISQAKVIAKRILSTFEIPFELDGHAIHCTASIGIALAPINAEHAQDLIKLADIAMYRAKRQNGEHIEIFQDNVQETFLLKYRVESELRQAAFNQDFQLNYQPIINSKTEKIEIIEALIRWPFAHTTQLPNEFIPIAEETDLIQSIGKWVLESALGQFADMLKAGRYDFKLAINVSANQLATGGFSYMVIDALSQLNIPANKLVLELTESALLQDCSIINETLTTLSEHGVNLALDDFGTGFSSLPHLLKSPIKMVKIDRSIIQSISHPDSTNHDMLKGLAYMLSKLDFKMVAEGVETAPQTSACNELNIHYLQGYLFYQPMTEQKVKQLLEDEQRNSGHLSVVNSELPLKQPSDKNNNL
ncbi:two-component system response regulator [Pseudoalteromonas luteoviolacea]|uniref:Diguanylate cyclase n=1 Tax=Pseudoalteromonas luteoviolacea H33 TaxID=1365251 RepID=A0A167CT28_9GAMM|nr:GGDEF domain-containing response regulator [Pseudoalteromonas luteoviolacea]KZN48030.1 hypothetical protein N476_22560 [Pseudoalteromonas luteoviolacea H33]KZN73812.1 hypothetical protein N477_22920 [Pseudoalteromonas luteoviolacea H33-S]